MSLWIDDAIDAISSSCLLSMLRVFDTSIDTGGLSSALSILMQSFSMWSDAVDIRFNNSWSAMFPLPLT